MSSRSSSSKSGSKSSAAKKEPRYVDDESAVAHRVEVRVDDQVVYLQQLYNAKVEGDEAGLKVSGSVDRPKVEVSDDDQYNPTTDEPIGPNVVTATTESSVPVPDPRDTEDIIEQFHDGSRE